MSRAPGATDRFAVARAVADTVLYEGYVLYPYRASARKNQLRWQFGVVAPRPFAEADGGEDWAMQTECLLEAGTEPSLDVRVRFLRVRERRVERATGDGFESVASLEYDDELLTSFDEAEEVEIDVPGLHVAALLSGERTTPIALEGGEEVEVVHDRLGTVVGRVVRRRHPASGGVRVTARAVPGDAPLVRLTVRIENETPWGGRGASRDDVARRSFVGVHTLLAIDDGRFLSLSDPPEHARAEAARCSNLHTWPVLVGEEGSAEVILSSPVTLPDHPEVAPESPGDMFDATEIDEILALRVMTLTEDEKREARSTDPRAAAVVDRCDLLPPEILERLHGAVRSLRAAAAPPVPAAPPLAGAAPDDGPKPWWDPAVDGEVDPFEERIWVGSVWLGRGTRVRLRPTRRADAHDLFLAGKEATVEGVFRDVDGGTYVAVTVLDGPEDAFDLGHGRYLYFYPDEVEPLVEAG